MEKGMHQEDFFANTGVYVTPSYYLAKVNIEYSKSNIDSEREFCKWWLEKYSKNIKSLKITGDLKYIANDNLITGTNNMDDTTDISASDMIRNLNTELSRMYVNDQSLYNALNKTKAEQELYMANVNTLLQMYNNLACGHQVGLNQTNINCENAEFLTDEQLFVSMQNIIDRIKKNAMDCEKLVNLCQLQNIVNNLKTQNLDKETVKRIKNDKGSI